MRQGCPSRSESQSPGLTGKERRPSSCFPGLALPRPTFLTAFASPERDPESTSPKSEVRWACAQSCYCLEAD